MRKNVRKKKKEAKLRKEGSSATQLVKVGPGLATSCFFSDNNYWLIPLISGERDSGQKM